MRHWLFRIDNNDTCKQCKKLFQANTSVTINDRKRLMKICRMLGWNLFTVDGKDTGLTSTDLILMSLLLTLNTTFSTYFSQLTFNRSKSTIETLLCHNYVTDVVLMFLLLIWTYFTLFSSVSIADFKQVNVS